MPGVYVLFLTEAFTHVEQATEYSTQSTLIASLTGTTIGLSKTVAHQTEHLHWSNALNAILSNLKRGQQEPAVAGLIGVLVKIGVAHLQP